MVCCHAEPTWYVITANQCSPHATAALAPVGTAPTCERCYRTFTDWPGDTACAAVGSEALGMILTSWGCTQLMTCMTHCQKSFRRCDPSRPPMSGRLHLCRADTCGWCRHRFWDRGDVSFCHCTRTELRHATQQVRSQSVGPALPVPLCRVNADS